MKKCILTTCLSLSCLYVNAACPSWATAERYKFSGDEVLDSRTGLVWKRCSEGQSWSLGTCLGSASGYTHEGALGLARAANPNNSATGWRLPNVKELNSLTDLGCQYPTIDRSAFPATPQNWFWTSSSYVGDANAAWIVDFGSSAFTSFDWRSGNWYVRLVRSPQ